MNSDENKYELSLEDIRIIQKKQIVFFIFSTIIIVIVIIICLIIGGMYPTFYGRGGALLFLISVLAFLTFNYLKYYKDLKYHKKIIITGLAKKGTKQKTNKKGTFIEYFVILNNKKYRMSQQIYDSISEGQKVDVYKAPHTGIILYIGASA